MKKKQIPLSKKNREIAPDEAVMSITVSDEIKLIDQITEKLKKWSKEPFCESFEKWQNKTHQEHYMDFLYPRAELVQIVLDDQLSRVQQWLRWHKPQVAETIDKKVDRIVELLEKITSKFDNEDLFTVIALLKGSADNLATSLQDIKEIAHIKPTETGQGDKTIKTKDISQPKTQIRLTDFLKIHCASKGLNIESKKRYINRLENSEELRLPKAINAKNRKNGQPYIFYLNELIAIWPSLYKTHISLPVLKSVNKQD